MLKDTSWLNISDRLTLNDWFCYSIAADGRVVAQAGRADSSTAGSVQAGWQLRTQPSRRWITHISQGYTARVSMRVRDIQPGSVSGSGIYSQGQGYIARVSIRVRDIQSGSVSGSGIYSQGQYQSQGYIARVRDIQPGSGIYSQSQYQGQGYTARVKDIQPASGIYSQGQCQGQGYTARVMDIQPGSVSGSECNKLYQSSKYYSNVNKI